jgi:molybdate/tungstate transport system substrate-binding protein
MAQAGKALLISLVLLSLGSCGGSKPPCTPLRIFATASLNAALSELEKSFESEHQQTDVRVEVSGSLVAARKVSEYKDTADLVISADKRVIEELLIPQFADWEIVFSSNEIVLAFSENSRHAAEVDSENWPRILLDPQVRVARVDENLGPLGYQTLLVWKLADIHYKDTLHDGSLLETLSKRVTRRMIRPDGAELLPTLGTEADYIFVYRSMAHDQNLKHVLLPPQVNLSSPAQADFYAKCSVVISGSPGRPVTLKGEPILYALTIPREAPNFSAAVSFVQMLLGPQGQTTLRRHGFLPLSPARFEGRWERLPESLRDLVAKPSPETETRE